MKNHPLPEFAQNILEKFANLELLDQKKSKGFHLLASLKNNPQAKFAVIIQKRKNLDYIPDFEAVKSLPIFRKDIEKAKTELKETYYLKYPLFIWLCDTASQVIYYYHLSYSGLGEWSENKDKTFHFYFSTKNKITHHFPDAFAQEVALATLDNRKYAQPFEDYPKVFPVLFTDCDEIETILEHFRMDNCLPELILEKYPKTENLPPKLVDGLLQIFINHSNSSVKKSILSLFIQYDIRSIIPHLLKTIERQFAQDNYREFHGYGDHLYKKVSDWDIDPFLEALVLFQVKEPWVYPQLRHLLSYNLSGITQKVASIAFLLDFPEAYPDFANGLLKIEFSDSMFSEVKLFAFDEGLTRSKLSALLQETNKLQIKIELLKYLESNIYSYQTIIDFSQSTDNQLNTFGNKLIEKYFDYEGYWNSEAENEIIRQAYEKTLDISKEEYLNNKEVAKKQQTEKYKQEKQIDFWEAYKTQDFDKLKQCNRFTLTEVGENERFIEVFKNACRQTENLEFYGYIIQELIQCWIYLHPKIQEYYRPKKSFNEERYPTLYNLSSLFEWIKAEINQPHLLVKQYLSKFLKFAFTYDLIIEDEIIIQHYQNGLLELGDLCSYLSEEKLSFFVEAELSKDLEVNDFLDFFKLLALNKLALKFRQSIENQCIKLLQNPHNFYHLPFLKFIQIFVPSVVADSIWQVCQKHTWDIATWRGDYQYDYLQYHLNILTKANHPQAKEFLFELLKRENIKSDYGENTYQRHIYELILANFGEEGEKALIAGVAENRNIFNYSNLEEILKIDYYYPCRFTG